MAQRLRIALLLPRFSRYGGVEQFGYRLAKTLTAKGHAVEYICARKETEPPQGVRVRQTGRPFGPRWLKMLVFALGAERLRRREKYDFTLSLGKTLHQDAMRVGGGPLRQFWRFSDPAWPPGPARWWKRLTRRLSPANLLTLWIEKRQYRRAEGIVAVSHFVRDLILAEQPDLADRITVIYNRPDLTRFFPPSEAERAEVRRAFRITEDAVAVGLATSNFVLKGTGPLIRALALLPESYILLVAGGRKPDRYLKLAEKLGVAERVRFLGRVDDMPAWYRSLDAFVLPSFYDACSNAVLEALASGLPVLSTRSNGSSFFLPPGHLINDPGDPSELAQALRTLDKNRRNEPFQWPDDVDAGMDAFVAWLEASALAKKS